MARRKKTASPPPEDDFDEHIVDIDVEDEMRSSYLEYAYSVIYSRALPDARDGLKPVQRRILYTMSEMGLRPDRGHVKSARVVGEVMGRLHPHGDSAIYDALVRMVEQWSMRLPLVDGHGNFGSPDDPPAAMRYSECRMAPAALPMTQGTDEDTVDFKANYDGQETEPVVLPAAFPNLLVNGASGIAVGMATNLAPHNLVEVVQALRHLIDHPDADTDDLMRFVPGPDLPTGGKIVGLDGIRDAYETGKGSFKIQASARVEQVSPRRKGIVVTQLPYNVGPERVVERIVSLVQAKKLKGIADIKNLTDETRGLQLVIEVKNGFNADALLAELYKHTPLEESFAINAVALVDGQPRVMTLKEMLQVYLEHRYDVVRRRSAYRRQKARDRLHLVAGLLIAILDIDEVIQLIRSSDNTENARERLIAVFDLTDVQARYILDMPLRRLTRYSRLELEQEQTELEQTIEHLTALLEDDGLLKQTTGDELAEVAKQHGSTRRTVLLESSGTQATAAVPLEVADDPCHVLLSSTGLLARTTTDDPLGSGGARARHDAIIATTRTTARGEVGLLTTTGRVIRLSVLDLPALPPTANAPNLQGGAPMSEIVGLAPDERVLSVVPLTTESLGLALGTRNGLVKRVQPEVLTKDSWQVISLAEGDALVGAVELVSEDDDLVFVSSDAHLLRFPAAAVRPQGRSGRGIAGIRLGEGAHAGFFGAVDPSAENLLVTVAGSQGALPGTEPGTVKVTPLSAYPGKGRATGGVRCHRFLKGEDVLLTAFAGAAPVRAAAASGAPVDLPEPTDRRDGSGTPAPQPIAAIGALRAS